MHHPHRRGEPNHITPYPDPEIPFPKTTLTRHVYSRMCRSVTREIEAETQRDDQSWHDDIAQTEHREILGRGRGEGVLGGEDLDGGVYAFCDGHHDGGGEDLGLSAGASRQVEIYRRRGFVGAGTGEAKGLTQKMSYTSKTARRRNAVKKLSNRNSAKVVVDRQSARTLERMYGRPRGMYSAGMAILRGRRKRDGRDIGRW